MRGVTGVGYATQTVRRAFAGYSGSASLWQKLKQRRGCACSSACTCGYWDWCDFDVAEVDIVAARRAGDVGFSHVFASSRRRARTRSGQSRAGTSAGSLLDLLGRKNLRASRPASPRGRCARSRLPLGLIDVKVCAIAEVWSGLKFVWRVERRAAICPETIAELQYYRSPAATVAIAGSDLLFPVFRIYRSTSWPADHAKRNGHAGRARHPAVLLQAG